MDGSVAYLTSMEPTINETNDTVAVTPKSHSTTSTTTTIEDGATQPTTEGEIAQANSERLESKKRKIDDMVETTNQPDWISIERELSQLLDNNDTVAKKVINFLQHSSSSSSKDTTTSAAADTNETPPPLYMALPPLLEKERRTRVHAWIKERLGPKIVAADTIDQGVIRLWPAKFRSKMPNKIDQYHHRTSNNNSKDKHNTALAPPRDRPYLQFVLYKENMDTGLALQMIGQRAGSFGGRGGGGGGGRGGRGGRGGNQNNNRRIRLGYAGNKDKRGITCQYITIPARDTSIKHICNVFNGKDNNNNNHDSGGQNGSGHTRSAGVSMIRIGNFQYVRDELRLGRLRGNRFDIALRNIRVDTMQSSTSTEATKTEYQSMLTKAVQDLQQFGFINYFGVQRFGTYHNTHIIGLAILRGDFQGAIDTIVCPPLLNDSSDDTVNTVTTSVVEDIDAAPSVTQKATRDDAIRSAQLQWKNRFLNVSVNELSKEELATIEQNAAKQALSVMNHYMQSEIAVLQVLVREPLNYEKAFGCIHKTMRMMFIHAVQSLLWNHCATYRMETYGLQVVAGDLVLANNDSYNDHHHEGCPEVNVVTASDIIEGRYKLEDIVLPLIGVKTRNPDNSVGTYMNTLLKEKYNIRLEMIERMEKQRDFHCSGDYRKVICQPMDVQYELIEYIDELQPFIQTDFMKLNGIDVPHRGPSCNDSLSQATTTGPDHMNAAHRLVGMTIRFTLPSSAYATMCLRELMKRPTSSEYQRELQLGHIHDTIPKTRDWNNITNQFFEMR